MTLSELKISDLTKVLGNYYYLPGDNVHNCFFVLERVNRRDSIIDPISLKEMLTDLSDRVQFGNNFQEVANCLNLPPSMMYRAKALDFVLMDAFSN